MPRKHSILSIAMIGLLAVTACAPSQSAGGRTDEAASAPPPREKVLTAAIQREIASFDDRITGATGGAAFRHAIEVVTDGLTAPPVIEGQEREMRLATELPSTTNGGWVVKPDGTMDMTWKLVRNAKWHDGTPLTAADYVFGVNLRNDKEVAKQAPAGGAQYIRSIDTPDPYTLVTHWSQLSLLGQYGAGLEPLPRHILEPVYKEDKTQLQNHRYFSSDFVSTGPFKLTQFEPGSHQEFTRFDEYYRGPAKVSKIILRQVPDTNTMTANFLAGGVDLVLYPGIELELALELKDRFQREGTGHQVIVGMREQANNWELQVDPIYARPVNGMPNALVRQGLLQAIDREEIAELMTSGYSPVATQQYAPGTEGEFYLKDYIFSPNFPYKYPYDPRKAQELLAQAGWTTGSDGMLVHSLSGERFDFLVHIRQGGAQLKHNSVIQQNWKAVGANLEMHTLTTAEQNDNKFIALKPGAGHVTAGITARRIHSSGLATEANNWTGGNNRGRWNNPETDRLIEKLEVVIDPAERKTAYREYLDHSMGLVAFYPFFWEPIPWIAAKGVTGMLPVGTNQNNWWAVDRN